MRPANPSVQVRPAGNPRAREAGVGFGGASYRADRALCVHGRCAGGRTGQRRRPWRRRARRGGQAGDGEDRGLRFFLLERIASLPLKSISFPRCHQKF
jgi:hypothetical protein